MQLNNNLNSLIQLEKKLEERTQALAKLNQNGNEASTKQQKNIKQDVSSNEKDKSNLNDTDPNEETVEQVEIPIAYSVNANVVSVQKSAHQTILDIKA